MQNSHHQIVFLLSAVFTLLQLVVLLIFGYTPYPDSDGYILLAEECVAHDDWYPIATKLNDYPFLWNIGAINAVVLSLKLFHTITPLLIIYCLMKGTTAWLLYQLIRTISNGTVALVALVLYILYPANYGEATSTLSELPFMFFTMMGLWLCITKKMPLWGGILLAGANWFRPMGIVFLLSLMAYLFFIRKKTLVLRPMAGYIIMVLLIGTLCYQRTGLFLFQAKTGWMALTDYVTNEAPESQAVRDYRKWNVSQKDVIWQSMFFNWLLQHPAEYVEQMPAKLTATFVSDNVNLCTFIPDKEEQEYMYEEVSMLTLLHNFPHYSAVQWFTLLNLLYYYALLLTALYSLRYFRKEYHLLPLCIIVLDTLLLLFAGHGEARFHHPLMPFITMMSAITLIHIKK